ncbi:MAG: PEGA domain-containing protein [Polyangiales bacterium]
MKHDPPIPSRRGVSAGAAAFAALLATTELRAQATCPSAAEAEADEAQGQQLNQRGDHAAALARFEHATSLCHGARAQARTSITLMALGRWGEADEAMRAALARGDDPWVSANRAALEQQRAVIATHVGELLVTGERGRGEVTVDARRAGEFPMRAPVRVTAGTVVVRVDVPGHHPVERRETVTAGQRTLVQVTLVPLGATSTGAATNTAGDAGAAVPPPTSPSPSGTLRTLAWVSAGLAAVGLGVGVWATAARFDRRGTYDTQCPTGYDPAREGTCRGLLDDVSGADVVAPQVAGFVGAGVFAAAAVALFVAAPTRARVTTFRCGPGGFGAVSVGCEGRF